MANFAVHGKLGTGKSKYSVYVIRLALAAGRRAAANFPIDIGKLLPRHHRIACSQIPARPSLHDLQALGHGNPDSYDEEKNGVLILDELAVWLNSRTFQEKERGELLHWLVHSRKYGWDVYFLCQNPMQIDRQVRESLLEYSVRMKKLDKVRLPFVGYLMQMFGLRGTFPRGTHSAVVRLGFETDSPLVERSIFKGLDLHDAYDTRHVFESDPEAVTVTLLGPRYFEPLPVSPRSLLQKIAAAFRGEGDRKAPSRWASSQPAVVWPSSVMNLPPGSRFRVAWVLADSAERSRTAQTARDRAARVRLAHASPQSEHCAAAS